MSSKAFEGIKVAEFSWVIAGPVTDSYLAEHGATVIKVESHNRLDFMRTASPLAPGRHGPDTSMGFGRHNANKYGVSIDLKHPNGQKLALKLIMWADIVTENFTPGVMEKCGLDYESVSKLRPDIIYLSSSMQGQEGPHAKYAGFGMQATSLSGFTGISGWPDRMPMYPYGAYTDYIGPRFNAAALIAALEYRRINGKGQLIEQSQCETALQFLSPLIMDYLLNGRIAGRQGNRLSCASPHGVFPCKGDDCWVAIAVFNDTEWRALDKAMGNPAWTKKAEFATLLQRKINEDELEERLSEWTVNYTNDQVESMLQAVGVAANMAAKPSDMFKDPQVKHRRHFVRLDHPVMGRQAFESLSCYILSKTPREVTKPSPCIGEHNIHVFKDLLGMTEDEIADYIADGSITTG
ncbi:CaiB/BaiF CoA transferase family protein [Chloroflexota bacterium]